MRLTLREGGPPELVLLSEAAAETLNSARILTCVRTVTPGLWQVSATTKVGTFAVEGLQVTVRPKIDITRLVFLAGYARNPAFWRDEDVSLDADADLTEALAASFSRLARRALDQGLLKGYRTTEEALTVVRGRIRESDQIRRHFGRLIPIEVRYDDYTVDIAENQILAGAAEVLLRLPLPRHLRTHLLRIRLQLADVTRPKRERPNWRPSRLNARYQPALALAELILDGRSFEQRDGGVTVSGFLLDLASLFENFVTVALTEALASWGGRATAQFRTHLDAAASVPIQPDFVWLQDGRARIVADAKYKAEKPAGFPQADLYQMLAYATVLGLTNAHLIYAKGNEPAVRYDVTNSAVTITAHTVDLGLAPGPLLASMHDLARVLAASLPPPGPRVHATRQPAATASGRP